MYFYRLLSTQPCTLIYLSLTSIWPLPLSRTHKRGHANLLCFVRFDRRHVLNEIRKTKWHHWHARNWSHWSMSFPQQTRGKSLRLFLLWNSICIDGYTFESCMDCISIQNVPLSASAIKKVLEDITDRLFDVLYNI